MKNCTNAGRYKELVIFRITKSLLEISTLKINLENLEKQGKVAISAQECFVFYLKFQRPFMIISFTSLLLCLCVYFSDVFSTSFNWKKQDQEKLFTSYTLNAL